MVTTWNGEEARLFVNGRDAADGWRSSGIDMPAFYNEVHDLFVGADNLGTARDLNGYLGCLNIYDEVLTFKQIREKYHASLPDGSCQIIVEIVSPRPGEVILPSTKLAFSVSLEGECGIDVFTVDKFSIECSNDPEFSTILYSTEIDVQDVLLYEVLKDISQGFETAMFIRIVPQKDLAKAAAGTDIGFISLAVPVAFDTTASVTNGNRKVSLPATDYTNSNVFRESSVSVYNLSGKRIKHVGQKQFKSSKGVYLVKLPHSSKARIQLKR